MPEARGLGPGYLTQSPHLQQLFDNLQWLDETKTAPMPTGCAFLDRVRSHSPAEPEPRPEPGSSPRQNRSNLGQRLGVHLAVDSHSNVRRGGCETVFVRRYPDSVE